MQQTEEADAEAEAQRDRGLRLVDERGVVELELVQGVTQHGIVRAVDGIQAREHHGLGVLVATQGLLRRVGVVGDRVAHLGLTHVLHAGDEVAHLARGQTVRGHGLRGGDADLEELVGGARGHHADLLPRGEPAVHDAHVRDDAPVGVVHGVEDHRAGRGVRVPLRAGDGADHAVQQVLDADARLAGDAQHVLGLAADQGGQLGRVAVRIRGGQVDLVEHGDDLQLVLHGEVEVRQGLGLDALGGVHQQDRALACGQRAGDLIGEVHVPGGVDHVQGVVHPVHGPGHAHGLGLDGDAALTLDVHAVQVLGLHVARLHDAGGLQHAVRQRGLAVVDVGDDAEVADHRGVGGSGHRGFDARGDTGTSSTGDGDGTLTA